MRPQNNTNLISVSELAARLSVEDLGRPVTVSTEQLRQFAIERKFPLQNANGELHISSESLGELLEAFSTRLGVRQKCHTIPAYLRSSTGRWAQSLVRLYESKLAWPAALPAAQGEFLKALVCNTGAERIVEIGCFIGVSSIWMAAGLEELGGGGRIHSIDLFANIMPGPHVHYRFHSDPLSYAQKAAADAQLTHRISFHETPSGEAPSRAPEVFERPIDLLFIDGDHTIAGCLEDFAIYAPFVRAGGYIVLHDIYPETSGHEGPRWVIDNFIRGSRDFSIVELETVASSYSEHGKYGMALIRKSGAVSASLVQQQQALMRRASRNIHRAFARKLGERMRVVPRTRPVLRLNRNARVALRRIYSSRSSLAQLNARASNSLRI